MRVVDAIASALAREGVTHLFGVPGGGTSLDLIEACGACGIRFVLTRTETGAVIMAAAMAELTGSIGAALATQGPGTACAVNGVAQAWLDKASVVLLTDGWSDDQAPHDSHQRYDQQSLLRQIVKGGSRLNGDAPAAELEKLLSRCRLAPNGPVYIELTRDVANRETEAPLAGASVVDADPLPIQEAAVARSLLAGAKRPVIVAGLEARSAETAAALSRLAETLRCPVLTTYKAKGALPSTHPQFVGLFTGGALESRCVSKADLIVLVGFDPVELIGKPWPYSAPVLDVGPVTYDRHYVTPAATLRARTDLALTLLAENVAPSMWTADEVAALKAGMGAALDLQPGTEGLTPVEVVKTVREELMGSRARATVDAGAHMFSAMAYWDVDGPNEILISNGLSTMGFALPAAIAAGLQDSTRPAVCLTGDGGLLMCAGELATLAETRSKVICIVFNDKGLSLIELKQRARQMQPGNLRWRAVDFAAMAHGIGLAAARATTVEELRAALRRAQDEPGPFLIDVAVDPEGYDFQSTVLRG